MKLERYTPQDRLKIDLSMEDVRKLTNELQVLLGSMKLPAPTVANSLFQLLVEHKYGDV